MALTYSSTLKNTRMDAITTAIGASGNLVIGTASLSGATGVLATIPLSATAFGASAAGVITLNGTPLSASAAGAGLPGTAALAELRTSGGTVIVSGLTVGTAATNIILGTTSIVSGNTVTISSGTLTHG